eukprot:TRINITY_DN62611_c0_g1_i1.p1 TRINITY_DN62611_c0_g1~~TRINITY_DN62611_c0_g1_i1.p1  ORF type:complete len:311 (+),score=138.83 TRINITY_DN62611_c0_g1_i1:31-963(+)
MGSCCSSAAAVQPEASGKGVQPLNATSVMPASAVGGTRVQHRTMTMTHHANGELTIPAPEWYVPDAARQINGDVLAAAKDSLRGVLIEDTGSMTTSAIDVEDVMNDLGVKRPAETAADDQKAGDDDSSRGSNASPALPGSTKLPSRRMSALTSNASSRPPTPLGSTVTGNRAGQGKQLHEMRIVFYDKLFLYLFRFDPYLQVLFGSLRMRAQVMARVIATLLNINTISDFKFRAIASTHDRIGVKLHHYDCFLKSLILTIRDTSKVGRYESSYTQAWQLIFSHFMDKIVQFTHFNDNVIVVKPGSKAAKS